MATPKTKLTLSCRPRVYRQNKTKDLFFAIPGPYWNAPLPIPRRKTERMSNPEKTLALVVRAFLFSGPPSLSGTSSKSLLQAKERNSGRFASNNQGKFFVYPLRSNPEKNSKISCFVVFLTQMNFLKRVLLPFLGGGAFQGLDTCNCALLQF